MRFESFYNETRATNGGHKHLSLERSGDLRRAVKIEYEHKINHPNADDFIFEIARRYEEKWLLMRERKMTNRQAERLLDQLGFIKLPGLQNRFFYPDSFTPRPLSIFIAAIALAILYVTPF